MVNVDRLREALAKEGVTVEQAAQAVGVDRATLYRRLAANGARFTLDEVEKLANLLNLSRTDMERIFFDRELA